MRYFTALIFFFLFSCHLQGQRIEYAPVTGNPILKQEAAKQQKQLERAIKQHFGSDLSTDRRPPAECLPPPGNKYTNGESAYVVSGESVRICVDTVGFDTLKCQNCDVPSFGTVTADTLSEICFIYQADAGILLEEDLLFFEKCDTSNNTEDVSITIVIKRPGISFTENEFSLNEGETRVICAPSLNLPGEIVFSTILDCNDPTTGTPFDVTDDNECLFYAATQFANPDTVCVEFCDINCICDTAYLPIQVVGDTLALPFFDDFSYPGPYPDLNRWLDNQVYVNRHFGFQPPSLGVATFDGLDASGTPYGGGYGPSDVLTSTYLDLSGRTPGDNVYLNFYVQNKGNGFAAGFEDSLVVEFKLQSGEWEQVLIVKDTFPFSRDTIPRFRNNTVLLDDSDYLYDGFQFRFTGYGPRSGISSNWNIDYVRLDTRSPFPPTGTLSDLAFNQLPDFILKNYTAMPFWHFENFEQQELSEDFSVGVFNNFPQQIDITESSFILQDVTNNQQLFENPSGFITSLPVGGLSHADGSGPAPITTPVISSIVSGTKFQEYEVTYILNSSAVQLVSYPGVASNDTVRRSTIFDNYFAYDDGTAEKTVSLPINWQMAVEFTLNVPDTLRAIQMMHPHFEDDPTISFDLLVWEDLDEDPVYRQRSLSPVYPDVNFDTLQGYTTYPIVDENNVRSSIVLNPGTFYIGWEQVSSKPVQVGLDVNSLAGSERIHFRDNIGWLNAQLDPPATICMRAVMGSESPISTSIEENPLANNAIHIYPNPSNGLLHFDMGQDQPENYLFELYNPAGQLLLSEPLSRQKNLQSFGEGLFFIRLTNLKTQESFQHKLFLIP